MFFSLLTITGGVCAIIFVMRIKKITQKTFNRGVILSTIAAIVGVIGMIFHGAESIEDAAKRVSNAQFDAEGYATAKIAKQYFPEAQNIVVAGIGEPRGNVMEMLKASGYPSAAYIKIFDAPPFGASKFEIMEAVKAAVQTPEFANADLIVAEYSFPGYVKKLFKPNQKIIHFGSNPDKTLWKAGIIAVQITIKPGIAPASFPDNPKKFFSKVYDVKMNLPN